MQLDLKAEQHSVKLFGAGRRKKFQFISNAFNTKTAKSDTFPSQGPARRKITF